MSNFEPAVQIVLQHEGGWVDNPLDPGGATNYGISLTFYLTIDPSATPQTIHDLTVQDAINIYRQNWWDQYQYGNINNQLVADKVLDMSVLTGPYRIGCATQEAVNTVNPNANLAIDGDLGPLSYAAINETDSSLLLQQIVQNMVEFFESIQSPIAQEDLQGWLNRVRSEPEA